MCTVTSTASLTREGIVYIFNFFHKLTSLLDGVFVFPSYFIVSPNSIVLVFTCF